MGQEGFSQGGGGGGYTKRFSVVATLELELLAILKVGGGAKKLYPVLMGRGEGR